MIQNKKVLSTRELKRKNHRDRVKATTPQRLRSVIIKHLDIIFDETYHCDIEGKEKFEDFSGLFEKFFDCDRGLNIAYLSEMPKKKLLSLYQRTSRAAYYISQYHGLNTEILKAENQKSGY